MSWDIIKPFKIRIYFLNNLTDQKNSTGLLLMHLMLKCTDTPKFSFGCLDATFIYFKTTFNTKQLNQFMLSDKCFTDY